ncbi:riboflavin kinase/FMN adenylyltransferase [Cellulophaga sp. RHA19]|uniref:bifunctional riboflavin kinase/FAD synthetase n=1 Tax=Cellulophaga sp. RHA19 TaxID=1798237 RepID=UPI000C2CD642|nr:bifunctional riboflavin kinase/FAD synthetase [Cellulophaga sp. RHA19]PKB42216.1 riboflavin kinase/FMN adenylyltransferase [Cellulophaga sp. RHA19]
MITIKSISKFDKAHATVITIGTFDGVHIGHKKILERLINSAKLLEIESTVLTFFPHPRMVLQQDSNIKLLNTIEEKEMILSNLGLDFLIIHPFSKEFSRLSAIEFVRDLLVNKLNTKKIIIGYDHRFGRNRNADINDLRNYGTTFDFNVEEITAQEIDDVSVSSTKIRKALAEGDVSKANSYLGYNYMLTGIVTKGKGLGRQLNYPTANIYIKEEYKLIPKNGVYAVKAKLNNSTVFGMMNIGYNPTVNGTEKTIEVNFFNFDGDLYGKKIQVDILDRIRDEVKFNSLDDLKEQLAKDQETATSLIAKL